MSQASTTLTGQDYFLGNSSVVRLAAKEYVVLKGEGILNVEDLEDFEDDDIDNVVQNLRQPQDIWHATLHAQAEVQRLLLILPQYRLCHFNSFPGMALWGGQPKGALYWGGHKLLNFPSLASPLRLSLCTNLVLSD